MANKMLIDASHPEETRVVVVRGNRIEEFDFESEHKKQIRGNIYLARVTRVEPSLQAAFVEYGGNRHGFLAFSEIHPDYYQIPFADRKALLEAEALEHGNDPDEDDDAPLHHDSSLNEETQEDFTAPLSDDDEPAPILMEMSIDVDEISENVNVVLEEQEASAEQTRPKRNDRNRRHRKVRTKEADDDESSEHVHIEEQEVIESVGAEDALEELPTRKPIMRRQYKIQEVIKRRQILLVQVVKEERGNKGAALTTYLSLAGRYSVLMPNTARGGGISRKITNLVDRKRLKDVVKELEVPQGMGIILRTAGANRTKVDINRDYEYLMRAWETVRNLTLQSTAPSLVYEEGSLIKRSIRDLYNKDMGEIVVSGEAAYREAKDFMRMLMPSHSKMVQPYRETTPIFARAGIEPQLDRMLQPQVTLKSGGYIIINQTEALVSIDVNSGRSTREHSIEETALATNLEAAEEVARQLRLRDLAGLVVIDFIDMEENRNNRAVEKRLKDHLKNDRARIQVGRISHFGLLEMSRQRIRASVLESTMQVCSHCVGAGLVRSQSSLGLHVVRGIEEYLQHSSTHDIIVKAPTGTTFYVLNHKRDKLCELEKRFGLNIMLAIDDTVGTNVLTIEKGPVATGTPQEMPAPVYEAMGDEDDDVMQENIDQDAETGDNSYSSDQTQVDEQAGEQTGDTEHRRKRRRRRRGRGGREETMTSDAQSDTDSDDLSDNPDGLELISTLNNDENNVQSSDENTPFEPQGEAKPERTPSNRRRHTRSALSETTSVEPVFKIENDALDPITIDAFEPILGVANKTVKPRSSRTKTVPEVIQPLNNNREETELPLKKTRTSKKSAAVVFKETVNVQAESVVVPEPVFERMEPAFPAPSASEQVADQAKTADETSREEKPRKGGWWQRKGFF
jgi:ribonuclease E